MLKILTTYNSTKLVKTHVLVKAGPTISKDLYCICFYLVKHIIVIIIRISCFIILININIIYKLLKQNKLGYFDMMASWVQKTRRKKWKIREKIKEEKCKKIGKEGKKERTGGKYLAIYSLGQGWPQKSLKLQYQY